MPDEYVATGASMKSPSSENVDDRLQARLDLLLDEAVQRAVEEDVLAAGEVAPEAGAELELGDDLAAAGDAAGVQRHDPRQHAQRRGLAGAVAPDHADGLAGLDAQRDVAQRLHRRRPAGALAADQHLLQRAAAVGLDAERARGVLEDDLARAHALVERGAGGASHDHRQLALHAAETAHSPPSSDERPRRPRRRRAPPARGTTPP